MESRLISQPQAGSLARIGAILTESMRSFQELTNIWLDYEVIRSDVMGFMAEMAPNLALNGRDRILAAGGAVEVPLRPRHRVEGIADSVVLEIAQGKFDEEDIVRIDDDYGRAK